MADSDDEHRITYTSAKLDYGLKDMHLRALSYIERCNPYYRSGPPMRLYLLADVEDMKEKCLQEAMEKERLAIENTKIKNKLRLERYKIHPESISERVMYEYCIGDFLTNKKPMRKIMVIRRRYQAYKLLKSLDPIFHQRIDILQIFTGIKFKKNRNLARLATATLRNAINMRSLFFRTVYQGPVQQLLAEYLYPGNPKKDGLDNLKQICNEVDAMKELGNTLQLHCRRIKSVRSKHIDSVVEILEAMSICRRSVERTEYGMRYDYDHPSMGYNATMNKIDTIKSYGHRYRRQKLKKTLAKKNLIMRPDSTFCKAFIEATTMATLEEVVATMVITNWLFDHSHHVWSEFHYACEKEMYMGVLIKHMTWEQASIAVRNKYAARAERARCRAERHCY